MKLLILLALLPLSASAAVVYRVDPTPVQTTAGNAPTGGFPAVYAVANATIRLCSDPACATPVQSYSDIGGGTQCPALSPVTTVGSIVCASTTNQQGGFGFWLASGTYYYTVTLPSPATGTYGPYAITVPATGLPSSSLQSPLNYGGVCNGSNNDTAAVLLTAQTLGYLWLPPGNTCVTDTLSISTVNFMIFGGGGLKLLAGSNGDLLHFDGTANTSLNGSHFQIEGVTLDGNFNGETGGTGNAIFFRNSAYSVVANCYIHQARGSGVHIENFNASNVADEINIGPNNFIFANGTNGVEIMPTSNSSTFQQPGDHVIFGNHINYNTGNGIFGQHLTSTLISNNNILTNGAQGILLQAADRVTLLGNMSRFNNGNGVFITSDATFGRSNDVLLESNDLHFNSRAGIGNSDEVDVFHTDRFQFVGNYAGDTDFTATAAYGLQLNDDTEVSIAQNIFFGTVHGALLPNGVTYSAYGNVGLPDAIPFLQNGTGAVQTTVNAKLLQAISVNDFGAVGDGSTDNSTALQNAFNYAQQIGGTLIIPAGVYNYSTTLQISTGGVSIKGSGFLSELVYTAASGAAINVHNSSANVFRTYFSDFRLIAGNAGAQYGIFFNGVQESGLDHMTIGDAGGFAVAGWYAENSAIINIDDSIFSNNSLGLFLDATGANNGLINITRNNIFNCSVAAMRLENSSQVNVTQNYIEKAPIAILMDNTNTANEANISELNVTGNQFNATTGGVFMKLISTTPANPIFVFQGVIDGNVVTSVPAVAHLIIAQLSGNTSPAAFFNFTVRSNLLWGATSAGVTADTAASSFNFSNNSVETGPFSGVPSPEWDGSGSFAHLNQSGSGYNVSGLFTTNNQVASPSNVVIGGGYNWFNSSSQARWQQYTQDAESGSNSGSNLYLARYNDGGSFLSNVLDINRATGNTTFHSPFILSSSLNVAGNTSLGVTTATQFTASAQVAGGSFANIGGGYSLFNLSSAQRWNTYTSDTESGSNTGSNFYLARYSDASSFIANVLGINRATGVMAMQSGGAFSIGPSTTPSDTATCTAGTLWFDASFFYVCTASGTVKRAALSSF